MAQKSFALRGVILACLAVSLAACSGAPKESGISQANRISILALNDKKPTVDDHAESIAIEYPNATLNSDWMQAGRNAEHAPSALAINSSLEKKWHSSIGAGSSGDFKLLAQPVVANGHIIALDAEGRVTAFDQNGDRLWRFDTMPEDAEAPAFGGGLGVEDHIVFVTTGFGETLALNEADGSLIWRRTIGKPFRSPPTLADGQVYVLTIDNELHALSANDGAETWHHSGITENATLMGSSSAAVSGDNVVVAYSSGEIFDLRAQTGRAAWSDVLSNAAKLGALPAIADIRGLPVIDRGLVFAISHGGHMAAIDLRTGDRSWEVDVGGVNTPAVVGNAVFVVSNDNELIAMARATGQIVWINDLKIEGEDRAAVQSQWAGPVMAGGQLWLANSAGHVLSFDAHDGHQVSDLDLGEPIYIAPIVANATLYVLTDKGRLVALH